MDINPKVLFFKIYLSIQLCLNLPVNALDLKQGYLYFHFRAFIIYPLNSMCMSIQFF